MTEQQNTVTEPQVETNAAEKPARTRKNRSTNDVLQGARDRKQTEVIKLEVRQQQVIDELKAVEAKLHDARAELGRLDLALGGGSKPTNGASAHRGFTDGQALAVESAE